MKQLLLIGLMLTVSVLNSQHAEHLFREKYSRVGFEFGIQDFFITNHIPSGQYLWASAKTGNFGLGYNFYQNGNLSYKVSALYSFGNLQDEVLVENLKSYVRKNMSIQYFEWIFLPIEIEYLVKLAEKFYFSPVTGIEIMVNPHGEDRGGSGWYINSTNSYIEINTVSSAKKYIPVYLGFNFGFSVNYALKPMLIKLNVKYHYQLEDYIYEGITGITDNGNVSFAKHNITGDYFGFGIAIVPNKNFFR
jgi:hypothetical protein